MSMGMGKRKATGLATMAAMAGLLVLAPQAKAEEAGNSGISDKIVKFIMDHTWDIMPKEIIVEGEKGKPETVVKVDKDKRETSVKEDEAREVIKVAYLSSKAEDCGMKDLAAQNYKTLMLNKQADAARSKLDIVYINQMHLFTVGTMRKLLVASDEAGKAYAEPAKPECSPETKAKVTAQIEQYIKDHPVPAATASASANK